MNSADVLEPEIDSMTVSDDSRYEIVDDRRVELPPRGTYAVRIASAQESAIEQFAKSRDLGRAITESLFRLKTQPKRHRRPDAAFVSFERWPKGQRVPTGDPWDVIPDLVVEVVSPNNLAEEIPTKVRDYFEAGVKRAWVIYPHESLVYEYDSPRSIRVLDIKDTLEGGLVIEGFRHPLSELFEGTEAPEAS